MHELARDDWGPDKFKQFLITQGPDAVHNFAEANRAAKGRMVADYKAMQPSMNAIDTILKKMEHRLDGLTGRRHTIDVQLNVNAHGSGSTVSDRNLADALAKELIRGQN